MSVVTFSNLLIRLILKPRVCPIPLCKIMNLYLPRVLSGGCICKNQRAVSGAILDVAVDLRLSSPTYGRWLSVVLSAENKRQYFVPPGFAHGFKTLEDNTIINYKCTAFYHKESEVSIQWDDPDLNIDWELDTPPLLSEKDLNGIALANFENPFE